MVPTETSSTLKGSTPAQDLAAMDQTPSAQPPDASSLPQFHLWEPAAGGPTVALGFDVVDRLSMEVMRGFGAVPRRGAEVGGILLGWVETTEGTDSAPIVHVEDFVPVPCQHAFGPSYALSDIDRSQFDKLLARHREHASTKLAPIGYYRSNTRDQIRLAPEDVELIESRFPGKDTIALLVKPYVMRPSEASFFVQEEGRFSEECHANPFPFRRKELGGGASLPGKSSRSHEQRTADSASEPAARLPQHPSTPEEDFTFLTTHMPPPEKPEVQTSGQKLRSGWVWLPLSFVFLLLGVVLGFQIAMSFRAARLGPAAQDPYTLALTVGKFGDSLHLRWSSEAPALLSSQHGTLEIQDGDNRKVVELSLEDLARGGVLYKNTTGTVKFVFKVFPSDRQVVSESIDFRVIDSASPPAAK
jgi:hypothetical protein